MTGNLRQTRVTLSVTFNRRTKTASEHEPVEEPGGWIPGGVPADLIRAVFLVNENPIEEVRAAIAAMDVPRMPDFFIDPDLNGNLPFEVTLDL